MGGRRRRPACGASGGGRDWQAALTSKACRRRQSASQWHGRRAGAWPKRASSVRWQCLAVRCAGIVRGERFQGLAHAACDLRRPAGGLAVEQGAHAGAFGQALDLGPPAADDGGGDPGLVRRRGIGGGARNANGDQVLGAAQGGEAVAGLVALRLGGALPGVIVRGLFRGRFSGRFGIYSAPFFPPFDATFGANSTKFSAGYNERYRGTGGGGESLRHCRRRAACLWCLRFTESTRSSAG